MVAIYMKVYIENLTEIVEPFIPDEVMEKSLERSRLLSGTLGDKRASNSAKRVGLERRRRRYSMDLTLSYISKRF